MTGWELTIVSTASVIVGLAIRELPAIVMDKVFMRDGKKNGNGNGRLQLRDDVKAVFVDTLDAHVQPALDKQTLLLGQIAKSNEEMARNIAVLVDRGLRID